MNKTLFVTHSLTAGGATKRIKLISQILKEKGYTADIVSFDDIAPYNGKSTIISLSKFIIFLWRLIRRDNYTVIVCNSRGLYPVCKIISTLLKVKYVNFVQIVYKNQPYLFKLFYANDVLCVSEATREYLTTLQKIPHENIYMIKNSTPPLKKLNDKEIDFAKVKFNITSEFVISCIARFHKVKGHKYLIESFNDLIKTYPNTKLLLMGYGNNKKHLKLLVNRLDIADKVIFIKADYPVNEVMMISDVLALPSFREGLPTMILEAFSLGKTVVATDIPGTNEIIKHNFNGMLFPVKNSEAMTKSLIKLIEDEDFKKRLEINSEKTYQNEFSFNEYKKEIVRYFKKL